MKRVTLICDECLSPRAVVLHGIAGMEELRLTCTSSLGGARISLGIGVPKFEPITDVHYKMLMKLEHEGFIDKNEAETTCTRCGGPVSVLALYTDGTRDDNWNTGPNVLSAICRGEVTL